MHDLGKKWENRARQRMCLKELRNISKVLSNFFNYISTFQQNTCMHQKPQVCRGKCIKKGQILADGDELFFKRMKQVHTL